MGKRRMTEARAGRTHCAFGVGQGTSVVLPASGSAIRRCRRHLTARLIAAVSCGPSCSASPCSYLDQIGNKVTSVTKGAGAGQYTLNTVRTYSRLKCNLNASDATNGYNSTYMTLSCSSCSALQFFMANYNGTANANSFGTLICQGSY